MANATFKETAKYWNEWACQSAKLVRDCSNGEDEARLRIKYILLSYALELMVKSRLVAVSNITEEILINKFGHDVPKILTKLKYLDELENIGIKSLPKKLKDHIYSIETIDVEVFYYHDFTNIRYYPKPVKDLWDTEDIVLSTTKIMLGIGDKVRKLWNGV